MAESLPDHAAYPPSSLGNMEKCPGFKNRKSTSEASERGNRIHKALELGDIETLVEDERPVAQMCQDYMDGVIQEHRPAKPDKDIRERQGKMVMDLRGEIETFGTPDRLLIYGSLGEMFDYKSGYREVADAKTNAQAWSYVLGAFQKYPELETIHFYILIPNRDEVFDHTFKREDCPNMALRLNTIIRRAMAIDWSHIDDFIDRLNPGPELCEYCAFQTICPALTAKHLSVAAIIGEGLPVPGSLVVSKDRISDIPKILRLIPLMEKWAENARAEALRLNLQENVEIKGFKRHTRKSDRGVNSVLGTWEAVKGKVELKKFLSICGSVSMPSLEKFFKETLVRGQKSKAGRDLECALRDAGVWIPQTESFYLREAKK